MTSAPSVAKPRIGVHWNGDDPPGSVVAVAAVSAGAVLADSVLVGSLLAVAAVSVGAVPSAGAVLAGSAARGLGARGHRGARRRRVGGPGCLDRGGVDRLAAFGLRLHRVVGHPVLRLDVGEGDAVGQRVHGIDRGVLVRRREQLGAHHAEAHRRRLVAVAQVAEIVERDIVELLELRQARRHDLLAVLVELAELRLLVDDRLELLVPIGVAHRRDAQRLQQLAAELVLDQHREGRAGGVGRHGVRVRVDAEPEHALGGERLDRCVELVDRDRRAVHGGGVVGRCHRAVGERRDERQRPARRRAGGERRRRNGGVTAQNLDSSPRKRPSRSARRRRKQLAQEADEERCRGDAALDRHDELLGILLPRSRRGSGAAGASSR